MSHHTDPFAPSVHTAHEWLAAVADGIGSGDRIAAHRALRAWLHTVRDRLTVHGAAQFSAQLPELLRGTFYEGWVPGQVPVPHDAASFLDEFSYAAGVTPEAAVRLAGVVTDTLADLFSPGMIDHVLAQLPVRLRYIMLGTQLPPPPADTTVIAHSEPSGTDDLECRVNTLTEALTALVHGLEFPAYGESDGKAGLSAAQRAHRILLADGLTR